MGRMQMITSEEFSASMKRYGELLMRLHDKRKIKKSKLVRLAIKHKQWINLAHERGIYVEGGNK